jgi:hypothetical protein
MCKKQDEASSIIVGVPLHVSGPAGLCELQYYNNCSNVMT